jgi:hypothetical protein
VAEKAFTGMWVMDEGRMAVEKGYRVLKCMKSMNIGQHSTIPNWGGLFVDHINTFLKLKAEASSYTAWVRTPQDEDYIEKCVRLDRATIQPNAAKRGIAKLCLNSMWSKLTERNYRTKTKMFSDPQELFRFLATTGIAVAELLFASDDVVWASWR